LSPAVESATTEDAEAAPAAPSAPSRLPGLVRVVSHLGVWGAVLAPTIVALQRGWRPFGDDAAIASRSWQVFSAHPPLLGLASAASNQAGHEVYGLGPLLFYLLAVPVHIDPGRGLLWGAAMWCGLVLSLAIEAAWRAGRWVVGAVVALVVLDLLWLTPQVFSNLAWNASFPIPFLVASAAFAWLVGTGSTEWWPVLVVTGSVVAQAHLFLAIPAGALVVAALALGLFARGRSGPFGWVAGGCVVGVLCWVAPLVQQFTASVGNLWALLHANHGQSTLGASFGLRDLAMAGAFRPIWLTHLPIGFYPLAGLETVYPAFYGVLILVGLGVVTVAGLIWRRPLGVCAGVTLALAAGLVVSLSVFPTKNILSLGYLLDGFWVLGAALWVCGIWTVIELVRLLARPADRLPGLARVARGAAPWALLAGTAAFVALGALDVDAAAGSPATVGWSRSEVALVHQAVTVVEHEVPQGGVGIIVAGPDFYDRTWTEEGIVYRLESAGWQPGTIGPVFNYTGLRAPPGSPTLVITITGTTLLSVTRA
jgi:hypothetical protein